MMPHDMLEFLIRATGAVALLGAWATAQAEPDGPDFAALEQEITWRQTEDGEIQVKPSPSSALPVFEAAVPVNPRQIRLSWLPLLVCGSTDVASITDPATYFHQSSRAPGDAELFQTILGAGPCADRPHGVLDQLLAIRWAQRRGLRPAIGLLSRVADSKDTGDLVAEAAREALASLRGERTPPSASDLIDLNDALRSCPANFEILIHFDQSRLPPATSLTKWLGDYRLARIKSLISLAGGSVSTATWAGARIYSSRPTLLPYDLARRFGNARIDRTVIALGRGGAAVWIRMDGVFDPTAVRRGLTALEIDTVEVGGDLTFASGDLRGSWSERHLELHVRINSRSRRLSADVASQLAAELQAGAPVTALVTPEWTWPSPWEPLTESECIEFRPPGDSGVARLDVRYRTDNHAERARNEFLQFQRSVIADATERDYQVAATGLKEITIERQARRLVLSWDVGMLDLHTIGLQTAAAWEGR